MRTAPFSADLIASYKNMGEQTHVELIEPAQAKLVADYNAYAAQASAPLKLNKVSDACLGISALALIEGISTGNNITLGAGAVLGAIGMLSAGTDTLRYSRRIFIARERAKYLGKFIRQSAT